MKQRKATRSLLRPYACRVGWRGQSPYTAEQLVAPPQSQEQKEEKEEAKSNLEKATELLRAMLAAGPTPVKRCKAEAVKLGLSHRTLACAAKGLNVRLTYFDADHGDEHTWSLPTPFENDGSQHSSGPGNLVT